MKIKIGLLVAYLLCGCALYAQSDLTQWNQQRLAATQKSMWILGSWAALNLAVGAAGSLKSGGEQQAFHQMNLGWGLINGGLATAGLLSAMHTDPASFNAWQSLRAYESSQRIFLFNTGLDVGYLLAGAYLIERSRRNDGNKDRFRGFGKSILLQGAFLFVFDLGTFLQHKQLQNGLQPFLNNASIGMAPTGVSFRYTLGAR